MAALGPCAGSDTTALDRLSGGSVGRVGVRKHSAAFFEGLTFFNASTSNEIDVAFAGMVRERCEAAG